ETNRQDAKSAKDSPWRSFLVPKLRLGTPIRETLFRALDCCLDVVAGSGNGVSRSAFPNGVWEREKRGKESLGALGVMAARLPTSRRPSPRRFFRLQGLALAGAAQAAALKQDQKRRHQDRPDHERVEQDA